MKELAEIYAISKSSVFGILKVRRLNTRGRRKISVASENEVCALCTAGLSGIEISTATGVSASTISTILKRNSLGNNTPGYSVEIKSLIADLYISGTPTKEIAEQFRINRNVVVHILKQQEIKRNIPTKNRKLTDKQKEEVVFKYNSGRSSRELAGEYDVAPCSILELLRRRGVQMRGSKIPAQTVEKMKDLRAIGATFKDIAKTLEVSPNTVSAYLSPDGFEKRKVTIP